jgi:hypothetical protein
MLPWWRTIAPAQVKHEVMAAADHPYIGDRMVRGTKREGRPQRHAVAGTASGAVDARRLEDFSHSHGREMGASRPVLHSGSVPLRAAGLYPSFPELRDRILAQTRC